MNAFQIYLYIWFGIMTFSTAVSGFVKRSQAKKAATAQDFVLAAFALGGAITLFRVLIRRLRKNRYRQSLSGTVQLLSALVLL